MAELNALAAAHAVMKFKKLLSFYADVEDERHCVYATDTNEIHNRYGETEPTPAAAYDAAGPAGEVAEDAA